MRCWNQFMKDLFGNEITVEQAAAIEAAGKKKRTYEPKGYPARPGTGPAGETCRTCANAIVSHTTGKNWWKCLVIRHRWTHGPGTDIRLKSPACSFWKGLTERSDTTSIKP